jgi:hypothetical protein
LNRPSKVFFARSPIASKYGVAIPDAALIDEIGNWWVVEVEIARHSAIDHVELQLQKLREGFYTAKEHSHLIEHNPGCEEWLARIDIRQPRFLLILDDVASVIERVARDNDFEIMHIFPHLSGLYVQAAFVASSPLRRRTSREGGTLLRLEADPNVARFSLASADLVLPTLGSTVFVGRRAATAFLMQGGHGFVVTLSRADVTELIGVSGHYVLVPHESGNFRVIAVPTS